MKYKIVILLLLLPIVSIGSKPVKVIKNSYFWDKLMKSCVAHWPMNDDAATTDVIDSVGGYNGSAIRNTEDMHVEGKINGALSFNGTNDRIDISNLGVFDSLFTPAGITVSCWYKPLSNTTDFSALFGDWLSGAGGTSLKCGQQADNLIGLYYDGYPMLGVETKAYSVFSGETKFYHIVVVLQQSDESTVTMKLYVDGVLVASDSAAMTIGGDIDFFYIGAIYADSPYGYCSGSLDDFRIFNKAISQKEIDLLYNGGNGRE